MNKLTKDFLFIALMAAIFVPFILSEPLYQWYLSFNGAHGYWMAFIKFAILATVGEMIGLRIRTGEYLYEGFGIVPRAILWGGFGVWIAAAMKTFAFGSPVMLESFGIEGVVDAMKGDFSLLKLFGAFSISFMMNSLFAPVFMTLHKITDTHLLENKGSIKALVRPINMTKAMTTLNWDLQWNFVFKKTLPFFWLPAHTITFLLPVSSQVLFAALLSIALGVILSIAAVISRQKK